ncbi:GAF domain-containing protein, partial [Clavibacter michiganensis]|uniref:GAF domain-containing protein n=1 Tax=Clavibacter michiganensis TaxID=28447 RepID=UPI00292FE80B
PSEELTFLAVKGFKRKMTDYYRRIDATSETPCGIALKTGTRFFVDFDDETASDQDGSMKLHREAGYLSAQSTPLIARSGEAIGMISTHWQTAKHRLDERELRFLDLLARQAADLIEQRQAERIIRESEARIQLALAAADLGAFVWHINED